MLTDRTGGHTGGTDRLSHESKDHTTTSYTTSLDLTMRHATAHFHASHHPIVQSFTHGEAWRWCYVHENYV
jgi:hypothetical protein